MLTEQLLKILVKEILFLPTLKNSIVCNLTSLLIVTIKWKQKTMFKVPSFSLLKRSQKHSRMEIF